jgi:glycosyltransferase involved in cell wall biosynthesis
MLIRLLTNFGRLVPIIEKLKKEDALQISIEPVPDAAERLRALKTYYKLFQKDVLLLNVEEKFLFKLCFLKYLFPWNRCLIISVDLILRAPTSFKQRLTCRLKGFLLKKVDHFILYHEDVSGYRKYFGITPAKCVYTPFKVNRFKEIQELLSNQNQPHDPTDGEYVMTAGRSLRDFNTFVDAMAKTNLPGILLRQEKSILAHNATFLEHKSLPPNLEEIVDYGTDDSFIRYMTRAKVVVIPRFRRDINATGIATYLMAMALKKCVIISHGPGTTDLLLNDEAILVPPENADALSAEIERAWNDSHYRQRIAANGHRYALSLKDERRLMRDILKMSLQLFDQHHEFVD